jgi:hypothetical protein
LAAPAQPSVLQALKARAMSAMKTVLAVIEAPECETPA